VNSFKSLKTLLTALTVMASMNVYGAYNNCETYCAPVCEPECCEAFGGRFAFDAEFLYWNATSDNARYATVGTLTTSGGVAPGTAGAAETIGFTSSDQYARSKYSPGFRLGVGYQFDESKWDTQVLYTNFYGKSSRHNNALVAGQFLRSELDPTLEVLFPADTSFVANPSTVGSVSAALKTHLTVVDLNFGRSIDMCRTFSVRPHLDVRYAKVRESLKGNVNVAVTPAAVGLDGAAPAVATLAEVGTTRQDINFWGVGPMAGLDLNWNWAQNWSIYGKSGAGLLLGKSHRSTSAVTTTTAATTLAGPVSTYGMTAGSSSRKKHDLRLAVSIGAGVEWKTTFLSDDFPISIAAGWEHHLYMSSKHANGFYGLNVGANMQF